MKIVYSPLAVTSCQIQRSPLQQLIVGNITKPVRNSYLVNIGIGTRWSVRNAKLVAVS